MEKAIHKIGFIQGLHDIVAKLARADDANSRGYLRVLVEQHGVVFSNYPTSEELKVYLTGTGWSVKPGSAIDVNRDLITVPQDFNTVYDFPGGSGAREHAVVIEYKHYYDPAEDVPFDKSYSDDGHTYAHNSFEIKALDAGVNPSENQIYLADLVYDGTSWSVVDKRNKNVMVLRRWVDAETPPIPTRLRLTTGYERFYQASSTVTDVRQRLAWIKAEFGDWGTGTASGNQFTWTTNQVGNWTVDEWVGQYLTDNDGKKWLVVDNDAKTLTLETGATPVSGNFMLGPGAKGYRFVLFTYSKPPEEIKGISENEIQYAESPVPMQYIWHGLTPNVKYGIRVASQNTWFPDEWSPFCAAVTIIAGGAKVIPDNCVDIVKNVVVTPEDDGIRIAWDVEPTYGDEVAGVEIVWTDDGSEPDFDTVGHRKISTDRQFVVLPSKMSTLNADVTVKAKIRAIDNAGRHCVTPVAITPTVAKKYQGDIQSFLEEIKTARGAAPSLNERLSVGLTAAGRIKTVTEIESEMADARGTYSTVGARIQAILQGAVDWGNVRIVAKSGGQYSTIQAAIDSIATSTFHAILVMPGEYNDPVDIKGKLIGIIGIGRVVIGPNNGRIYNSLSQGRLLILQNVFVQCVNQSGYIDLVSMVGNTDLYSFVDNVNIIQSGTSSQVGLRISDDRVVYITNTRIRIETGRGIEIVGGTQGPAQVFADGLKIQSSSECIKLDNSGSYAALRLWNAVLRSAAANSVIGTTGSEQLYMSHCRYNVEPNAITLAEDYGILENVSNVRFDTNDLEVLP